MVAPAHEPAWPADPKRYERTLVWTPPPARAWLTSAGGGPEDAGSALVGWTADELFGFLPQQAAVIAFITAATQYLAEAGWAVAAGSVEACPGLVIVAGRYLGLTWSDRVYDSESGEWSDGLKELTRRARWVRVLNLKALFDEKVRDLCTTTPPPESGPTRPPGPRPSSS